MHIIMSEQDMRCVGKYQISTLCYQSMPCKHYVINDGKLKLIGGDEIFLMLKKME